MWYYGVTEAVQFILKRQSPPAEKHYNFFTMSVMGCIMYVHICTNMHFLSSGLSITSTVQNITKIDLSYVACCECIMALPFKQLLNVHFAVAAAVLLLAFVCMVLK